MAYRKGIHFGLKRDTHFFRLCAGRTSENEVDFFLILVQKIKIYVFINILVQINYQSKKSKKHEKFYFLLSIFLLVIIGANAQNSIRVYDLDVKMGYASGIARNFADYHVLKETLG